MGSGEWGVGSGEWGVGSGEWGVGSGETFDGGMAAEAASTIVLSVFEPPGMSSHLLTNRSDYLVDGLRAFDLIA